MYILNVIKRMILDKEFLELAKKIYIRIFKFEWRRDYRRFNKLYANGEWNKAIELGEIIVENKSKDEEFFQELAICYRKLSKNYEAQYYMKKSLELRTKKNMDEIIKNIENAVFKDKENISSKYVYLGGRCNLGHIEHSYKVGSERKEVLTKIIPNESTIKFKTHREKFFNLTICKRFPEIQSITPKMINYYEMKREKIYLITFNKINNDKIQKMDLQEIINISENIIQKIKYDDAIDLLNRVDKGKNVPLSALMHKLSTHEFIFSKMKNKIRNFEDDINLNEIINRMKYIIIDFRLYEKINPKEDYVFSHRDLNKNNILYDKEKNKYYIIDWVNYGLALKGNDLVRFFVSSGFKFKEIEVEYLNNIGDETEDASLKKIFFAYDLIILWIDLLNKNNLQEQIYDCICPAVEYIEDLIKNKEKSNA